MLGLLVQLNVGRLEFSFKILEHVKKKSKQDYTESLSETTCVEIQSEN